MSREVIAKSATAASSTSMTTNGACRGVSRKVIHTKYFANIISAVPSASVAKEERVGDLLGNLRGQGLFSPPNFDDNLVDLRKMEEEFEFYVVRTRERLLLRETAYFECLQVCMGKLVKNCGGNS